MACQYGPPNYGPGSQHYDARRANAGNLPDPGGPHNLQRWAHQIPFDQNLLTPQYAADFRANQGQPGVGQPQLN